MRRTLLAVAICALGCPSSDESAGGDIGEYEDDDLPAGVCRGTGGENDTDGCDTDGTTAAGDESSAAPRPDDACMASSECMGGVCAAGFNPETLERGPLECHFACVPLLDDNQWCADDEACCDRGAVCVGRGYCVFEDADQTGTTTGK